MSLPLKTTADDVRAIVKYLKSKPTGATLDEARAVSKSMVDARKVSTYISWGVVERENGRLKLTDRGRRLGRDSDQEATIFREIVDLKPPYRSVIEWAYHQDMDAIDTNDVAAQWHEHHRASVGEGVAEQTLRDNAVCFFNVAQAASLGALIKGRSGHPTRLSLDRATVKAYVESGPATPPWEGPRDDEDAPEEITIEISEDQERERKPDTAVPAETVESLRVFISHGSNHEIVEQIGTMLGLADIEAEIAEAEETSAIPVPEKVLNAMRRCKAGIIAVTVDEGRKDEEGNYALNENVLIEIGAAFVLYDKRVVLLWDKRLVVPSNLQGLYRCEFEGDELSWSAGMKLMKAIQGFKRPSE